MTDLKQEFINSYKADAFEKALSLVHKMNGKDVREAFYWGCQENKIEFITELKKIYPRVSEDLSIFSAMAEIKNYAVIKWYQQVSSKFFLNSCFLKLCEYGYISVIEYLIVNSREPACDCFNLIEGFFVAACYDIVHVCKYLYGHLHADHSGNVVIQAFRIAANQNATSVMEYLSTIENCIFDINDILISAIKNVCYESVIWILQHWPETINYHYDDGAVFKTLCYYDYFRVINLVLHKDMSLYTNYVNIQFLSTMCAYRANNTLLQILRLQMTFRQMNNNSNNKKDIEKLISAAIYYGNSTVLEYLVKYYPNAKIMHSWKILQRVMQYNFHDVLNILLKNSFPLIKKLVGNPKGSERLLIHAISGDAVNCFEILTRILRIDNNQRLMSNYQSMAMPNTLIWKFLQKGRSPF